MSFEQWMQNVDKVEGAIAFGLSVHDLPDRDLRSLYDAGEMAQTAAEEVLVAADFPFEELGLLNVSFVQPEPKWLRNAKNECL